MKKKQSDTSYREAIRTRFLQLCDEVIREGVIESVGAFAESVGEYRQNIVLMERGSRYPTLDQLARACKVYGYSPTWLILGIGEKKLNPVDLKPVDQRLSDLEKDVARLKRLVKQNKTAGSRR